MSRKSLMISCAAFGLMMAGGTSVYAQSETVDAAVVDVEAVDINVLFEEYDAAQLELSPLSKSYRGIRDDDYGEWGDFSDAAAVASEELLQATAEKMRAAFDVDQLSDSDALSYRLFDAMAERSAERFKFRNYDYIFDQMRGAQSQLPAFLINIHRVSTVDDAAAYVSRLEKLGPAIDQLIVATRNQADDGVMPPDWVFPYVVSDIENILDQSSNPVLEDFDKKIESLSIEGPAKNALKLDAASAWNSHARPAFARLLDEIKRQQAIAPTDDGVWRFPEGEAYYKALLANYTTTDLTANEVHNIGLREVERIHGEMRAIMAKVGFKGTLQDFFKFTRNDDQFFYTTREDYLRDAQAKLDAMEAKLPEYFGRLPKAPMVIKPVEAFREKSAGKAFYQSPAPDGSRPGTYYVNLYNLRDMSKNELEALAYHEGFPGHHLQRALQTEMGDLPPFRRFGGVTAYTEGWGLYTEELPKEMGFYQDPYSDFGRLGMELWRACRLVVDTGLHHKRWSREEAIQYLTDNTPNPDGDIRKAIERYAVYPGQATAYMIGKLKIMELRERAKTGLGDAFDIRGFHDTVLLSGPVPLSILEENVDAWIAAEQE
ncbi:DUF885 domain-containing protein [Pontixanthobacter aestiaquae]|uniref:DUF885 family protein n=1 Tax=Pontixanthobacter aestiaquae TaxID=1509367 RepID=A0A844Z4G3_9SPHN|nr:DUF885 domain-containing protein [Pontixanthobacter aestiaquae]MDN3646852.1 DUF885 domain-containing protein [Pontixanthobacter aestiaquae]MXO82166.1 DUF885 family protein [Pontixanthobacter aestiaquae]